MQFGSWDTVFNILMLVFWVHAWMPESNQILFNPYLASVRRLASAIAGFLRPAFFGLSERGVAAIAFVLLLVLRAFAAPREHNAWVLRFGFEWRQPDIAGAADYVLYSALSFAIFIFMLWGVTLIFVRGRADTDSRHTTATLHNLAQPFTRLPYEWRPGILLVFGVAIGLLLNFSGQPTNLSPFHGLNAAFTTEQVFSARLILQCAISALSAWVEILAILVQAMIVLIIGSWVAMFTGSQTIMFFCREWLDLIMGPMRNYPIRIGMIDLSPIVMFFILRFAYGILNGILQNSYVRL